MLTSSFSSFFSSSLLAFSIFSSNSSTLGSFESSFTNSSSFLLSFSSCITFLFFFLKWKQIDYFSYSKNKVRIITYNNQCRFFIVKRNFNRHFCYNRHLCMLQHTKLKVNIQLFTTRFLLVQNISKYQEYRFQMYSERYC